jgi:phosphoglycolate phosphatase-like HAD superfamily hydrolase
LNDRFNELAMDQLVKSPMIPGAREFVDYAHGNWPLFVASGAPQAELDKLLRLMDIHGHFKEIHGSPPHKSVTLGDIIRREQAEPSRVLMIGDSGTDLTAAQENGTLFLGIGSFNGYPCIPDLITARETITREFGA